MKYTLTVIKAKYLDYDVLIPIVENSADELSHANLVIEELQSDSQLKLIRKPLWQFLHNDQEVFASLKSFYQVGTQRKIIPIHVLEKDHSEAIKIETPLGDFTLPRESSYKLYAVVSNGDSALLHSGEFELSVLILNKNKESNE